MRKRQFFTLIGACAVGSFFVVLPSASYASPITGSVSVSGGCSMPAFRSVALPKVLDMPDDYAQNSSNPIIDQIGDWNYYVMSLSSNARVSAAKRSELIAVLVESANADFARWPKGIRGGTGRGDSIASHTQQILTVATVAYLQNRQYMDADNGEVVRAWLKRMLTDLEKGPQLKRWKKTDGKRIHMGAIWAVVGYALGDRRRIDKGYNVYTDTIAALRTDGSIPVVTGRGGMAIFYQNSALASLAVIADIAEAEGKDLYAFSRGGRSFHLALEFLLKATRDPSLIATYARTDGWEDGTKQGYGPERQYINWTTEDPGIWGHLYLRRFGGSELGKQLKAISPLLRSGKIGANEHVGGNARCYAGSY